MAGVKDTPLQPKGFQQLTGISSSTALTVPAGARYALLQADTAEVRWRDDGVAPTATIGMKLLTTSDGYWYSGKLSALRVISATGVLNVSYYA